MKLVCASYLYHIWTSEMLQYFHSNTRVEPSRSTLRVRWLADISPSRSTRGLTPIGHDQPFWAAAPIRFFKSVNQLLHILGGLLRDWRCLRFHAAVMLATVNPHPLSMSTHIRFHGDRSIPTSLTSFLQLRQTPASTLTRHRANIDDAFILPRSPRLKKPNLLVYVGPENTAQSQSCFSITRTRRSRY